MSDQAKKLDPREFVTRAIQRLRTDKSKGVHVVFSGLNKAWDEYYPETPAREGITALTAAGHFITRPCKKGVMIYLPGDAPTQGTALDTILGAAKK